MPSLCCGLHPCSTQTHPLWWQFLPFCLCHQFVNPLGIYFQITGNTQFVQTGCHHLHHPVLPWIRVTCPGRERCPRPWDVKFGYKRRTSSCKLPIKLQTTDATCLTQKPRGYWQQKTATAMDFSIFQSNVTRQHVCPSNLSLAKARQNLVHSSFNQRQWNRTTQLWATPIGSGQGQPIKKNATAHFSAWSILP